MHNWTGRSGFPLVVAEVGEQALLLKQSRFFLNPKDRETVDPDTWPIPLLAGEALPELFDKAQTALPVETGKLTKLNIGQTGFYRVSYDQLHIDRLAALNAQGKLGPLDRLGLLADAFEIAKAGYAQTEPVLKLLASYADEDDAIVWDMIAEVIGTTRKTMESDISLKQ